MTISFLAYICAKKLRCQRRPALFFFFFTSSLFFWLDKLDTCKKTAGSRAVTGFSMSNQRLDTFLI